MDLNKNNKKTLLITIILIVIILISIFKLLVPRVNAPTIEDSQVLSPDITHSNGIITFKVPENFGLAASKEQLLVSSYIPACDEGFDYCVYYNGTRYENTNFNSAGLRIKNMTDLNTADACLNTSPVNYTGLRSKTVASTTNYIIVSFDGIGDAGAGHMASGELYRLAYDGTCYEFETRVGLTQFANYPAGSIKEFTVSDQNNLKTEMQNIIYSIVLKSGEKIGL